MKQAAGSLDALGKEAKTTGDELSRPVWGDHERTLGRISDAAGNWNSALGGVATAADDVEDTLRRPAWVEHGRSVVQAAEAARGYRAAMGDVGAAASAITAKPWQEAETAIGKAEQEVESYGKGVTAVSAAYEDATAMLAGFIAAHAGLKLAEDTLKAGADAAHQQVSMETAGATPEEQTKIHEAAARLTGEFTTQPQTEIEGMITRARAIVQGGTDEAIEAMPELLKLKTITEAEMPGASEGFEQILRGLEIGGYTKDAASLHKAIDLIARTMNVNKGSIRPEDYNEFFKYLGSAYARHLDPDFMAGAATTIIQELRGSSAGVGLRAFEGTVFADRMYGKAAQFFEQEHLIADESKVERNSKTGKIKSLKPGALVDPELALRNPFQWLTKYVATAFDKQHLNDFQRTELEMAMFQNSGASQIADIFLNQPGRVRRDMDLSKGAMGADESFKAWLNKDPTTALKALQAQGENWLRSAGEPVMSGLTGDVKVATKAVTLETQNAPSWLNTILAGAGALGGGWLGWAAMKQLSPLGGGGLGKWLLGGVETVGAPLLGATVAKEIADAIDPKGNFWGLTSPIDEYFKSRFGWNPANVWEPVKQPEGAAYDPLFDPNSDRNVGRTRKSLWKAGYLTWDHWRGYRDTGELDQEEDRESRRAAAASPHAMEAVGSTVDILNQKAKEAADQMHALEQPIAPKIETGTLDSLVGKLREAAALIGIINGGVSGMHAVPAGMGGARGAPLHDGPEAH